MEIVAHPSFEERKKPNPNKFEVSMGYKSASFSNPIPWVKNYVGKSCVTFLPQNVSLFTTTKLQPFNLHHHAWIEKVFVHPL
jgi:hypothetical protein